MKVVKLAALLSLLLSASVLLDALNVLCASLRAGDSPYVTLRPGLDFRMNVSTEQTAMKTKYKTNSLGLRGKDIEKAKRKDEIRILCMGDSCTFGIGGWVGDTETYVKLFEKQMKNKYPSEDITAIDGGVPGYSSFQGLELLKILLDEYSPDVVTVYFGWNDHWVDVFTDREKKLVNTVDLYLDRSVIYTLVKRLANSNNAPARTIRYSSIWYRLNPDRRVRVSLPQYEENLALMAKLCRARGIKMVIFTAPSCDSKAVPGEGWFTQQPFYTFQLHSRYNETARGTARKEGISLFDLDAALDRQPGRERLFADFSHLSRQGHALTAELLAGYFVKERIIDEAVRNRETRARERI